MCSKSDGRLTLHTVDNESEKLAPGMRNLVEKGVDGKWHVKQK
jgi:hypothetical protein